MNTKGSNRSVVRTQALLKDGLIELMLQKPIQKISVKELTDHVNLNRGTFYLHYKDIYDLLEQIENELLDEFVEINNSHQVQEIKGKPFPLLKDLFEFLEKNAAFVRLVLKENLEKNFMDKLKTILKERCFHDWETIFPVKNPELYEIFYAYMLSGCIGIIETWILNDTKQSVDEIARITECIILDGVNILK